MADTIDGNDGNDYITATPGSTRSMVDWATIPSLVAQVMMTPLSAAMGMTRSLAEQAMTSLKGALTTTVSFVATVKTRCLATRPMTRSLGQC